MKRSALLISGLLAVPGVAAQGFFPPVVLRLLEYIFIDVSGYFSNPDQMAFVIAKFILWIAAFSLVYYGLGKAGFEKARGVHITLSVIIALMGTLLIPNQVVATVWQTYSNIFGILLVLAPAIVTALLWKHLPEAEGPRRFIGGAVLVLLGYLYSTMSYALVATGNQAWMTTGDWGLLAGTFAFVGGVVLLATGMFKGKVGGGLGISGGAEQIATRQADLTAFGSLLAGGIQQNTQTIQQLVQLGKTQFDTLGKAAEAFQEIIDAIQTYLANPQAIQQVARQAQTAISSLNTARTNASAEYQAINAAYNILSAQITETENKITSTGDSIHRLGESVRGNPTERKRLADLANMFRTESGLYLNGLKQAVAAWGTQLQQIEQNINSAFAGAITGVNKIWTDSNGAKTDLQGVKALLERTDAQLGQLMASSQNLIDLERRFGAAIAAIASAKNT